MADQVYSINESTLVGIADAIRLKNGTATPIRVSDMPNLISNIQTGDVRGYNITTAERPSNISDSQGMHIMCFKSDMTGFELSGYNQTADDVICFVPHQYVGVGGHYNISGLNGIISSFQYGSATNRPYPYFLTSDITLSGYTYDAGCFVKGTMLTMADGSKKAVEDITYDDRLLVWDFDHGMFSSAKPCWIKMPQMTDHYIKLTFNDGSELNVTGTRPNCHRLFSYADGEFVYGNLMLGKQTAAAKDQGLTRLTVTKIECIDEQCEFFNVITSRHMNLFANDILTSSSRNNLYPIRNMKFKKDWNYQIRTMKDLALPASAIHLFYGCRLYESRNDPDEIREFVRKKSETSKR